MPSSCAIHATVVRVLVGTQHRPSVPKVSSSLSLSSLPPKQSGSNTLTIRNRRRPQRKICHPRIRVNDGENYQSPPAATRRSNGDMDQNIRPLSFLDYLHFLSRAGIIYHHTPGKKMQRGCSFPLGLHGKNGLRHEKEEGPGRVHEGPNRVGTVRGCSKRVLQLQAFAVEHEDAHKGREAVLKRN